MFWFSGNFVLQFVLHVSYFISQNLVIVSELIVFIHDVLTLIKLLYITVIQPLQIINLLPLILLLLRFIHQLFLCILKLIFQIIIQLTQISPLWLTWLNFTHFIGNAICLVIQLFNTLGYAPDLFVCPGGDVVVMHQVAIYVLEVLDCLTYV